MDQATHNKIVSFIWGIADDVLRDLFKRGKYPDVILPMCVIRRMDAVLEPSKRSVLEMKTMLDDAGITDQRAALEKFLTDFCADILAVEREAEGLLDGLLKGSAR